MDDLHENAGRALGSALSRRQLLGRGAMLGAGLATAALWSGERRAWAGERRTKPVQDTGAWAVLGDRLVGRPAAVLNGDKLEIFLRSDKPKNSLWVTRQKNPNGGGGLENWFVYDDATIIRDPAVARMEDGTVWAALVNENQEIRLASRKGEDWVQPWKALKKLDSLGVLGNPTLIPMGNGGLLLAARYQSRGSSSPLTYAYFMTCSPKGVWSSWISGSFYGTTDMVGHAQEDGSTMVFARDAKGMLSAALFKAGSSYPLWTNGLSSAFDGVPGVGQYSDGRLAVFVTGGDPADRRLYRRTQAEKNKPFVKDADWEMEGDLAVRGTVAVESQPDKKVIVVARDASGKIHFKRQEEADGGFADWAAIDSGAIKFNADPIIVANDDGRLEIMVRGSDSNLYHSRQEAPNGNFAKPDETPPADPPA